MRAAGRTPTLDSAGGAATNINAAIQSLAAFVRYVSPTNTSSPSPATNSRPFNVLDYGTAAGQIGEAAKNLSALLTTVNQSAASTGADRAADHRRRERRGKSCVLAGFDSDSGFAGRLGAGRIDLPVYRRQINAGRKQTASAETVSRSRPLAEIHVSQALDAVGEFFTLAEADGKNKLALMAIPAQ